MNRLKEYRQQAKLSQQALADKANCSRSYISAVELGNQKLTLKMARIFGKILHVDPYELLGADAIRYKGDFYTTLRSLLDLYLDMKLDKDTYVRRAAELNDKLNKIEAQIKAITTSTTAISEASFRAAIKYYFESLKIKSPDNLSILVNTFIERVILYPDRVVIIYKFKDAKGNYVKSNKGAVLNINSGGVYSRLSAEYSVSSYRDLLFNAGDLIKYTILV